MVSASVRSIQNINYEFWKLIDLLRPFVTNDFWKTKFQYQQTMIIRNKQELISVAYNSSTNPVESLDYIF